MDYDVGIRLDAINAKIDMLIKALSAEPENQKRRDDEDSNPRLSKKAPSGGEWKEA